MDRGSDCADRRQSTRIRNTVDEKIFCTTGTQKKERHSRMGERISLKDKRGYNE